MTAQAAPHPVHFELELPISPAWENVDLLRMSVLNCLAAVFGDRELGESVAIVTSELLENAIKYGDWSRNEEARIVLHVEGNDHEVRVEVTSPIDASSPHLENVRRTIAWIERFPTPREAYIARMQAIADMQEPVGISRMGLVRIAYEGPCAIEATLGGPQTLHVRASIPAADSYRR